MALYASGGNASNDVTSYPYPSSVMLGTRSAVAPPVSLTATHLPVPMTFGFPYDYTVNALYAKHDAGVYNHSRRRYRVID